MYIVLGFGRTGRAVAQFFLKNGISFVIFNQSKVEDETFQKYVTSSLPQELSTIKAAVCSPGFSTKYNVKEQCIKQLQAANVPLISDIQLFIETFPQKRYIAVTGTNGKSSICTMLHKIFESSGQSTALCGNIGVSPFENATDAQTCILEVSSFQLEITHNVQFEACLITNLTEDHLDRYKTMENYAKEKLRIVELSKTCIVNASVAKFLSAPQKERCTFFSTLEEIDSFYLKEEGGEGEQKGTKQHQMFFKKAHIGKLPIAKTPHNKENIFAAFLVAHTCGIAAGVIVNAISTFAGVPHRLEFVTSKNGIDFYNDSKATNIDSTLSALNLLEGDILLIAGGQWPGNAPECFQTQAFRKVKNIALIGASAATIKKALAASGVKNFLCGNLENAIKELYKLANRYHRPIILLSPFCKSFDQFKDFEERGEEFKKIVLNLV